MSASAVEGLPLGDQDSTKNRNNWFANLFRQVSTGKHNTGLYYKGKTAYTSVRGGVMTSLFYLFMLGIVIQTIYNVEQKKNTYYSLVEQELNFNKLSYEYTLQDLVDRTQMKFYVQNITNGTRTTLTCADITISGIYYKNEQVTAPLDFDCIEHHEIDNTTSLNLALINGSFATYSNYQVNETDQILIEIKDSLNEGPYVGPMFEKELTQTLDRVFEFFFQKYQFEATGNTEADIKNLYYGIENLVGVMMNQTTRAVLYQQVEIPKLTDYMKLNVEIGSFSEYFDGHQVANSYKWSSTLVSGNNYLFGVEPFQNLQALSPWYIT